MSWLWQNKEWFFQGLGALLIMGILGLVGRRIWKASSGVDAGHINPPSISVEGGSVLGTSSGAPVQMAGHGGINVTIGEVHHGLGPVEVREMALKLWEENFPKLRQQAANEAQQRIESFVSDMIPQLNRSLTSPDWNKFTVPEVQYSFAQALKAAALRKDTELRKTLASLVVKRVKSASESLDEIVYTEAIKTVAMLTAPMLDLLALKVFLYRVDLSEIGDWTGMERQWDLCISPLAGFSNSPIEFQHLVYSGCGELASMRIGSSGFAALLAQKVPRLFQRPISSSELISFKMTSQLTGKIFDSLPDGRLRFKSKSGQGLKELSMSAGVAPEISQRLNTLFDALLEPEASVQSMLLTHMPKAKLVIERWKQGLGRMLDLSSVGLVIGASQFEARTGISVKLELGREQTTGDVRFPGLVENPDLA